MIGDVLADHEAFTIHQVVPKRLEEVPTREMPLDDAASFQRHPGTVLGLLQGLQAVGERMVEIKVHILFSGRKRLPPKRGHQF